MSRTAGLFLLGLVFASAPVLVAASGKASDAMCPAPDQTHKYNTSHVYPAKYIENKVEIESLWRKPCSDSYVQAFCTASDFCDGEQSGSKCMSNDVWGSCTKITEQQLKTSQTQPGGSQSAGTQQSVPSTASRLPALNTSILGQMFNPVPIGWNTELTPTGGAVQAGAQQSAELPIDAFGSVPSEGNLFSKTSIGTDNSFRLTSQIPSDFEPTPIQTTQETGGTLGSGSFVPQTDANGNPIPSEQTVQTPEKPDNCDWICRAQVALGFSPTREVPASEKQTIETTGNTRTVVASTYGWNNGSGDSATQPLAVSTKDNPRTLDKEPWTFAQRDGQLGGRYLIENPKTGDQVVACLCDRGPYVAGRDIDVSKAVAQEIDMGKTVMGLQITPVAQDTPLGPVNPAVASVSGSGQVASTEGFVPGGGFYGNAAPYTFTANEAEIPRSFEQPAFVLGETSSHAQLSWSDGYTAEGLQGGFVGGGTFAGPSEFATSFGPSAPVGAVEYGGELAPASVPAESGTNLADQGFLSGNELSTNRAATEMAVEWDRLSINSFPAQNNEPQSAAAPGSEAQSAPQQSVAQSGQTSGEQPSASAATLAASTIDACGGVCGRGDTGDNIKSIQQALNTNGANIPVNGNYGPKTEAAVEAFQKANGLSQDGMVGPKTLTSLNDNIARNSAPAAENILLPRPRPADISPTLPAGEQGAAVPAQLPNVGTENDPFAAWRSGASPILNADSANDPFARTPLPQGTVNEGGQLQENQGETNNIAPKGEQASSQQEDKQAAAEEAAAKQQNALAKAQSKVATANSGLKALDNAGIFSYDKAAINAGLKDGKAILSYVKTIGDPTLTALANTYAGNQAWLSSLVNKGQYVDALSFKGAVVTSGLALTNYLSRLRLK